MSSTVDQSSLDHFGLWRSHLASVVDPADGYTTDEVVAAAALMRRRRRAGRGGSRRRSTCASCTPCPAPVRPPRALGAEPVPPPARPLGRRAHRAASTCTGRARTWLVVRASWTEKVDDVDGGGPQEVSKSDVVVRSPVGEREKTGVLFLVRLPAERAARAGARRASGSTRCCRRSRTPTTGASRTCRAGRRGTPSTSTPSQTPRASRRRASRWCSTSRRRPVRRRRVVLDAVPLLRWEEEAEPDEPFAWRQVRRSGVRIWLAGRGSRPATASCSACSCSTPTSGCRTDPTGRGKRQPKAEQAPDGATSLWGADPIAQHGGATIDGDGAPVAHVRPAGARRRRDRCSRERRHPAAARRRGPAGATAAGRRAGQSRRRRRLRSRCATCAGIPVGPGPGLPARVRRGLRALVRRRRAAGDAGAVAVRAARRRPLPAAVDRRLRAVAGGPDELGAAAADADAHGEPARPRSTCR